MKNFLNGLNTTGLRIVVSIALAIVFVLVSLAASSCGHPIDAGTATRDIVLLATMMGLDVTSHAVERLTNIGYVNAKAGTAPDPAPPAGGVG